mmetsp:Transcript_95087/g.268575  ORF Transcript_95087/g.268575 Transcript_95087/m.268575 type:complete len:419 (-) Transcript_95087:457-1713(-)
MSLVDHWFATVEPAAQRLWVVDNRRARTKPHRAPHDSDGRLGHEDYDGLRRRLVKLRAVRAAPTEDLAREFDDCGLETYANAQVRFPAGTAVICGQDLPFDATIPEAARHQHAIYVPEACPRCLEFFRAEGLRIRLEVRRLDPINRYLHARLDRSVLQRLYHAGVSVLQRCILAHEADRDLLATLVQAVRHNLPIAEVCAKRAGGQRRVAQRQHWRNGKAGVVLKAEVLADEAAHVLFLHQQGHAEDVGQVVERDNPFWQHLAKQRELLSRRILDWLLRPAEEQVWLDSRFAQHFHAVLARLRLLLASDPHDWDEAQVCHQEVLATDLELELLQGFRVHGALDVTHCATELHKAHLGPHGAPICGERPNVHDPFLDGVCDMRDHLHRLAEIIAPAFALDHVVVYLARGERVLRGQRQV